MLATKISTAASSRNADIGNNDQVADAAPTEYAAASLLTRNVQPMLRSHRLIPIRREL